MKHFPSTELFLIWLIAACQSAQPLPTQAPAKTNLPPPTATATATFPMATTATEKPSVSTSSKEPVYIKAFCTIIGAGPVINVPANTPVIVIWGWAAKTKSQLDDFINNNQTTIKLDGNTLEGTVNKSVTKSAKGNPEIAWYAEVGVLDVGDHTLTLDQTFNKLVDDGTTIYGPGGKVESIHDKCRVVVQ